MSDNGGGEGDDDNFCSGESGKKFRNGAKVIAGGVIIVIVIVALLVGNHKIQENKNKNGNNNGTKSANTTSHGHHKDNHHHQHKHTSHHHSNKTMDSAKNHTTTSLASSSKIESRGHHPSHTSASNQTSKNQTYEVCNSDACKEMSRSLQRSLNFHAKPCEDFYAFACGGWEQQNPNIPASESYIDEWSKLQREKVMPAMKKLFEGAKLDPTKTAHSVVMAQMLYKECVDQKSRDKAGWTPLLDQLHYLLGFDWPLKNGTAYPGHSLEATVARFAAVDVQPLIGLNPTVDKWNPSRRIIEFYPPTFGLSRYVFADLKNDKNKNRFQAYRNFLKKAFRLAEDASKASQMLAESALNRRVDAVLELETKLALATLPEAISSDGLVNSWANRMHYEDFKHLTASNSSGKERGNSSRKEIDWAHLVGLYADQVHLQSTFSQKAAVFNRSGAGLIVSDVNYFKNMTKLVLETELITLSDYFALSFLNVFRSHGPSDLVKAGFDLEKVTKGLKKQMPVWEQCLDTVQLKMPLPSAKLYVDAHVDPKTVAAAVKITDAIKETFEQTIAKTKWLDRESKERGKNKLSKARFIVGYPPELLADKAQLDRFFGFAGQSMRGGPRLSHTTGQYLKILFNVTAFTRAIEMGELWKRPMNDSEIFNSYTPTTVNAFAIRESNVTFIPIALLQPPFFDPKLPQYLQLAGIGETLAHELVHLFDDQNLKRKPNGQPADEQWWSDRADEELKKKADCFVRQYGELVDSLSALKVNGQLTLRENIADNGGVRTLWYTFDELKHHWEQKHKRTLPRLPQLEQFTPDQLLFIAHAQSYCSKIRPEAAREMMMTNSHAPNKYRVNVPLSNLEHFSKVFDCKKGSSMNAGHRCKIW